MTAKKGERVTITVTLMLTAVVLGTIVHPLDRFKTNKCNNKMGEKQIVKSIYI